MTKGRPILSDFGPESTSRTMGTNRATCGGIIDPKPIPYSPPVGPKAQMEKGPGSNSINHGTAVCQGKH